MTEFAPEVRHYCRKPKCRSKLPKPVSNERDAFCARGCHTAFYRKRCLVCEGPIERNRDDQKICRKAKCRSAWRARTGFGRYIASSDAKLPSKKPRSISWFVVAGPPEASVQTPIIAPLWGLASSSRAVHLARGYEFGNRNRGFPEAEGLQQAKVRIWSEVRILNMGENQ